MTENGKIYWIAILAPIAWTIIEMLGLVNAYTFYGKL